MNKNKFLLLTLLFSSSCIMSMTEDNKMTAEDAWNITHWWNNGTIEVDHSVKDSDNDPIDLNKIYILTWFIGPDYGLSIDKGEMDGTGSNIIKTLQLFADKEVKYEIEKK